MSVPSPAAESTSSLPRWVRLLDLICLLLVAIAAVVAGWGGFRERVNGVRVALTSPYRVLIAAAVVVALSVVIAAEAVVTTAMTTTYLGLCWFYFSSYSYRNSYSYHRNRYKQDCNCFHLFDMCLN